MTSRELKDIINFRTASKSVETVKAIRKETGIYIKKRQTERNKKNVS